jgi:hypothetical protein
VIGNVARMCTSAIDGISLSPWPTRRAKVR